jgi:hypothetical protein
MIFPALAPPLRKSPVRHSGSAWHFPPCRCGNDLVTESVHTSCSPGSPPTTRQLSSACSQPSDPRHTHPVLVRNHLHHFHLSIVLSPLAEPCLARSTVYTEWWPRSFGERRVVLARRKSWKRLRKSRRTNHQSKAIFLSSYISEFISPRYGSRGIYRGIKIFFSKISQFIR